MNSTATNSADEQRRIRNLIDAIPDPEVPVLTINDLGIVRSVEISLEELSAEVTITPTYSGCPAMDMISMNVRMVLLKEGYRNIKIQTVLSPAWTTDWISEEGRQRLKAYGIAPPGKKRQTEAVLFEQAESVQCPQCNSFNTKLISEFGSTSCKSLYQCGDCREPFDHFKCH